MANIYNFTKQELEDLYITQQLSAQQIAPKLKCSRRTVTRHLQKHSIPRRSKLEQMRISRPTYHFPTEQEIEQFCLDYGGGMPISRVAKKHGVSNTTVLRHLHHNGIQMRPRYISGCIYSCNEHFFDVIDSEGKAYWLGFLAADGYIKERRVGHQNVLSLGQAQVDKYHIQSFLDAIQGNHPIHCESSRPYRVAGITSDILCNRLIQLGVTPRKSLTLQFPELPNHLVHHYIRGYVDGDGCIGLYQCAGKRNKVPQIAIYSGSKPFLVSMQKHLVENCNVSLKRIYTKTNTRCHNLLYSHRMATRIIAYLYQGASAYLERKWIRSREILGYSEGIPIQIIPHYTYQCLLSVLKQWHFERDVCERYNRGTFATDIARDFNTCDVLIGRILKRHNVPLRSHEEHWALRRQKHRVPGSVNRL